MSDSATIATMNYETYFGQFNDLDQLKEAATKWVKEDVKRLCAQDDKIKTLEAEKAELCSLVSKVYNEAMNYQEDLEGYQIINIIEESNLKKYIGDGE